MKTSTVKMHARCGCGYGVYLKTLAAESSCPNCKWPIVYARDKDSFTVSRHVDLTITPTP